MAPDTKLSQHSPKLPVVCVALLHIGEVGWHGAHKPTWAPHNNARAQVAKWAGRVSLGSTKAGGGGSRSLKPLGARNQELIQ